MPFPVMNASSAGIPPASALSAGCSLGGNGGSAALTRLRSPRSDEKTRTSGEPNGRVSCSVSHLSVRYVLGTARLRIVRVLRNVRGRTRRWPSCSPAVPRPQRLRRDGRPMRLTHALVASDLNPRYLEFWPLVRRAWAEVAGIEAILVLIAEPADVPEAVRDDPPVLPLPPLPGI